MQQLANTVSQQQHLLRGILAGTVSQGVPLCVQLGQSQQQADHGPPIVEPRWMPAPPKPYYPDGPGRPTRRAGARVAILDGQLIAWMDAAGKRTLVYTDNLEQAARALRELAQRHGKASILEIDGEAAHDHHLAPSLRDAGFTPGYKGFTVGANRDKAETNRARPHRRTPH